MPDDFFAGETVLLEAELVDKKGRPRTPQPSIGVTFQVLDDAEDATVLAEGEATLLGEDSGTSSGSNTATTLRDASRAWRANQWAGYVVRLTGGTGSPQERRIRSNTADTLTIDGGEPNEATGVPPGNWSPTPDATTTYKIHRSVYQRSWAVAADQAGKTVTIVARQKDSVTGTNAEKHKLTFGSKAV